MRTVPEDGLGYFPGDSKQEIGHLHRWRCPLLAAAVVVATTVVAAVAQGLVICSYFYKKKYTRYT